MSRAAYRWQERGTALPLPGGEDERRRRRDALLTYPLFCFFLSFYGTKQ